MSCLQFRSLAVVALRYRFAANIKTPATVYRLCATSFTMALKVQNPSSFVLTGASASRNTR